MTYCINDNCQSRNDCARYIKQRTHELLWYVNRTDECKTCDNFKQK